MASALPCWVTDTGLVGEGAGGRRLGQRGVVAAGRQGREQSRSAAGHAGSTQQPHCGIVASGSRAHSGAGRLLGCSPPSGRMPAVAAEIHFGTDGWRAVVGDDFTYENVRAVAQGVAAYLERRVAPRRGRSRRPLLRGAVRSRGRPGPRRQRAQRAPARPRDAHAGGVVDGGRAGRRRRCCGHGQPQPDGVQRAQVQARLRGLGVAGGGRRAGEEHASRRCPKGVTAMPFDEAVELRPRAASSIPCRPYCAQLGRMVDLDRLRGAGLKVAHEAMYGAGAGLLARVLDGGSTTVTELHGERNPGFGGMHPEPIDRYMPEAMALMAEREHDVLRRQRRRRGPRRHHRRDRALREPARGDGALHHVPPREARRARRHRPLPDHHQHGRHARRALRRQGPRDARRLQVHRRHHARDRRAARRRGVRWFRLPRPHPRARRHPRRAADRRHDRRVRVSRSRRSSRTSSSWSARTRTGATTSGSIATATRSARATCTSAWRRTRPRSWPARRWCAPAPTTASSSTSRTGHGR